MLLTLNQQPEIDKYNQMDAVNQTVYQQINLNWQQRRQGEEDLVFRVGVTTNGEILGYKFVSSNGINSQKIPDLNDLLYKLVPRQAETGEPIIHFKVVFTKGGILEVSPWHGYK